MKTITSLVVFFFTALLTYGQTTLIDFDNDDNWVASSAGALSSYQDDHSYSDGVFSATAVDALRQGNGDQDGFPGAIGDYSWRLRNNTDTSWEATIASGGVEDFSVAIRRWDDSPSPDYNLEYSVDDGDSWEFVALIDNASLSESSDWTTFSGTIESDADDILIRIVPNSSGERIMIDDFEWTEFSAAAAGSGETCDDAFVINSLPFTDSQDTADFSNDYTGSDVPSEDENTQIDNGTGTTTYLSGNDVVYEFTPAETSVYNINLQATEGGWSGLYLFQGCNPFTTLIGYNTATSGDSRALQELDLIGGETYYIVVSSWESNTATVDYVLDVSELTCPVPTDLEVTGTSTDSVDFSWELAPEESNGYEYVVMPAGLDPIDDASEIVSSGSVASGETTATVSGLDGATPYDLFLRAECEANDFSDYISTSFATECVAVSEFSEDFEGLDTLEMPLCWSSLISSTSDFASLDVRSLAANSFSGNQHLRFYNSADADAELFGITPQLDNIGDDTHRLTFYARETGALLEVGTMTDPEDDSTFSLVETVAVNSDYEQYIINFDDSYTGDYIVFRVTFEGTYDYLYMDDVVWEEIPSCLTPQNLEIDDFGLDFVEFSWDAIDNAEDYIWSLYLESDDPEEDDALQSGSTSDLTVLIEDLDADEDYVVFVQTDCGEDDGLSGETSSVSFYTGYCIPSTGNTGDYITEFTTTGALTNVSIIKDEISPDGYDNLSATEVVTTYPGGEFNILNTFNYNTNNVGIWIDYNDDLEFDESEQVFFESDGSSATKTGTITIPSDLEEGSYRMRVRARYGTTTDVTPCGSQTFADAMDFTLEVGPAPTCFVPENFQADEITADSAELSWDAIDNPADEDAYTWYVFEEGDDPEADTPVATGTTDDLSVVVDELDADTSYEAYISADCGVDDGESVLSNPVSFYTGYCIPSTGNTGDYITEFTTTGALTNVSIIKDEISPDGYDNLSDTEIVTTYPGGEFNILNTFNYNTNNVGIWIDYNDDLEFDESEQVFFESDGSSATKTGTITIPSDLEEGSYRMRVRARYGTTTDVTPCGSQTFADAMDFTLEVGPAPTCFVPENFQADEITADSAELSWDAVDNPADQDAYTWYIFEEGDDPEEDTPVATGTTDDLSGVVDELNANTTYDAYIEADCGLDGESGLSEAVTFTTDPSCLSVEGIDFSLQSQTTVEISWDEVDNAEEYIWSLYLESDDPEEDDAIQTGTTTDLEVIIDSLDADEDYVVFVQTDCGEDDGLSGETSSVSFYTGYCVPEATNNFGSDYISLFETSTAIENVDITANALPDNPYRNLTDSETIIAYAGQNVDFDVTYADSFGSTQVKIWVDWNENFNFEEEEALFQLHSDNNQKSGTLEIPDDIENGTYRMRVRAEWVSTAGNGPTSCGDVTYGDTIDLTVEVTDEPDPVFANVQVIHNSPDPAASSVDVYLNGEIVPDLTGVNFRTASEFMLVPAEEEITVDIVPADGDISDSVYTENFTLDEDENYIIVANGVLDISDFDTDNAFELSVYAGAQQESVETNETDILIHHGSPDAPMVNILNQADGSTLVGNISYPDFDGYLALASDDYIIEITDEEGNVVVAYEAPLSTLLLEGQAVTVVASGFLGDDASGDNAFGLWVALADGGDLIQLDVIDPEFANVQLIHNSPDPAAEFVDVYVNGELAVEDFQFRTATEFLSVLAEEEITVDIVPAGDDISNSVFTYMATLVADENYIVVANGALNPAEFDGSVNGDINFGFDIYEGAQTASVNEGEVDVLVHHGSLDAPMVSVEETGEDLGMLVTDISYTEFEGYLNVAEGNYELDILDESGEILFRYEAYLEDLELAGAAITVIASGVLDAEEESDEFFGLWAALPNGGALVELQMIDLSSAEFNKDNFTYYPNPVQHTLEVRAASTIEKVEIFNTLGQRLSTERPNNASPSINMSNLQSGVYLMKVTIEGATKAFQVIKK